MKKYMLGGLIALFGVALSMSKFTLASTGFQKGFGLNGANVNQIGVAGAKDASDQTQADQSLVTTIKKGINVVLGFMSLITLIILLWGGFQMVTANGDDGKFQAGMKLLKQAALGLLFIAVSWMIVSMIFWVISTVDAAPSKST